MNPVDVLLHPLTQGPLLNALVIAIFASVVCAVLSCWLVLIGWSLMGDAVSHAVLPGVVLAYALGLPFAVGALVFGLLTVLLIGLIRDTTRVKEDAAIGTVFTTLFALGLVLISITPSAIDLESILFGDLLGVTRTDLLQVVVLGAIVLVVLIAKRRDFTLYAFDPTHAHAIGLSPRLLGAALLGLLALTAVVAMKTVGVILVVAMLITPGATAYLLTDRLPRMLVVAPILAAGCAVTGVYLAYHLDTEPGAMIVLAQGLCFAFAFLFSPQQGLVARRISGRSRLATARQ